MSFERVRKGGRPGSDTPMLTIYTNGSARFNKTASENWLEGVERIELYVDEESRQLGIARGGDGPDSFRLRKDQSGYETTIRSLFDDLGLDRSTMERSARLVLANDIEKGLLVADLEPLFQEVADGE